jgi:AraC-like DNA-binding protein
MYTESLSQLFDASSPVKDFEHECSYWARPDGKVFLQHFYPSQSISYPPHTHSEYHMVICLEGCVSKTQMGDTYVIEGGETVVGNFGVEHSSSYLTGAHGCDALTVTVNRRMLSSLVPGYSVIEEEGKHRVPILLGRIASTVLYECARDVVMELKERRPGYEVVIEGLAMRILIETLRAWPVRRIECQEVDWTPRLPRRDFVRAYEFMRWCRKDEFRLDHLSRLLGSSEARFARLFRASINESPANFFNHILLNRGSILLQEKSLSVKEIGYLLGFKTASHFVAAFHREFGITPKNYRIGGFDEEQPGDCIKLQARCES